MTALLDTPLGELACSIPGATRLFHQHKLDFCCGGRQSLREAAAAKGLDADALVAELSELQARPQLGRDWRQASAAELIAHILTRFHDRHREQLPELIRLANRVEAVHAGDENCPTGLAEHLWDMKQELESHMMKEEQILFPLLRRGTDQAQAEGTISVLRVEHDQHGDNLEQLMALTNDLTPPGDACTTWCALYHGLQELREDLMEHIHLENHVLFVERSAMGIAS